MANLVALAEQLSDTDNNMKTHHEINSSLVRAVISMTDTVECPSRIWTSNWNSNMIHTLGDILHTRTVNKKVQASLRHTIIDIGQIFAEGARGILEVRNTIQTRKTSTETN